MPRLALVLALTLLTAAPAAAHGVRSAVSDEHAVVVRLVYADGSPLSDVAFEVRSPVDGRVAQTGRTDRRGRASFVPDAPGTWTLDAVTADGHGAHVVIPVDAALAAAVQQGPSRFARSLLGLGAVILLTLVLTAVLRPRHR